MGQFKPMVKMMTTEPSVELKLKKGGSVKTPKKMMNGGVMGALSAAPSPVGARGGMAPAARPARPSMAARRGAMAGRRMPMMAEGGESKAEHKAEMEAIKGVDRKLSKHAAQAASKAHKGLKTGGVVMGQGGFKEGGAIAKSGIINTEGQGGAYRNTKMHTAEGEHRTPKKTGEVVMGKPAGYKKGGKAGGGSCYAKGGGVEGNVSTSKPGATNTSTGEVKLGNAGGYKKGGSAKKAYATGGAVNDSGRAVAMPKKPASKAVSNNRQSGTFKKGGGVKMAAGGYSDAESIEERKTLRDTERAYNESIGPFKEDLEMAKTIRSIPGKLFRGAKRMLGMEKAPGAVTETEKSVTVTPAKKRGGSVKC